MPTNIAPNGQWLVNDAWERCSPPLPSATRQTLAPLVTAFGCDIQVEQQKIIMKLPPLMDHISFYRNLRALSALFI
ncbi:hypothetical protein ACQVP2_32265 [Methylobacterium aquaticum]|uniref:hypothetical protein n=1 Tax=Methylobacterium aquaticum TaxID=270351 RepID=UPI003D17AA06